MISNTVTYVGSQNSLLIDLMKDWSHPVKEEAVLSVPYAVTVADTSQRAVPMKHPSCNPFTSLIGAVNVMSSVPGLNESLTEVADKLRGTLKGTVSSPMQAVHIMTFTRNDRLDMTVMSGCDILSHMLSGASYGYFMLIQDALAHRMGCESGFYTHVSCTVRTPKKTLDELIDEKLDPIVPTTGFEVCSGPTADWWNDVTMFGTEGPVMGIRHKFVRKVLAPVYLAQRCMTKYSPPQGYDEALKVINDCEDLNWRNACKTWLMARRHEAT